MKLSSNLFLSYSARDFSSKAGGGVIDENSIKKYNSIFKLSDRGILSVSGEDATSFLQGLTTNDMNIFAKNPHQAALYSLFLNPKGRILYDGIIVKSQL